MKYFDRLKTSKKLGLISSMAYATTMLAVPAFAHLGNPVQPLDIEKIITVEQAKSVYNEKLAEYAGDKIITCDEIIHLSEIKDKERSIIKKQFSSQKEEESKLMEKAGKLDKTITSYKEKLISLDNRLKHPRIKEGLERNLARFEKEVLIYYPGLVNKGDRGITYSAEKELDSSVRRNFQEIFKDSDDLLKNHYGDDSLSSFLGRSISLREVVAFYEILKDKIGAIKEENKLDSKAFMLEKLDLTNKIKDLESKKNLLVNSEHMEQLKFRIGQMEQELDKIYFSPLMSYERGYGDIKEFTAFKKDLSDYFSLSLVDVIGKYSDWGYQRGRRELGNVEGLTPDLESYFKAEGFDVKVVDGLRNPAKPRWPLWIIPLVLVAPMIRNKLLIMYLGGGKQTRDDYSKAFWLGMAENVLFYGLFDGFHPLVFPIRMAGIPILWHGLLKATGGDKGIYDYAK